MQLPGKQTKRRSMDAIREDVDVLGVRTENEEQSVKQIYCIM